MPLAPLPLRALHHSTYPGVIWHCGRRQAFGAFFLRGRRRRREPRRGGAAGGETMRGVLLCSVSIRAPSTTFTHPAHGRGGAEGSEAAWSSGQEGEKKIRPTAATSIQYFVGSQHVLSLIFFLLFFQSLRKKKHSSSKTSPLFPMLLFSYVEFSIIYVFVFSPTGWSVKWCFNM